MGGGGVIQGNCQFLQICVKNCPRLWSWWSSVRVLEPKSEDVGSKTALLPERIEPSTLWILTKYSKHWPHISFETIEHKT